jgi:4-hydroxy-3-methylbut-2-enyl diphosphate reductase IspH
LWLITSGAAAPEVVIDNALQNPQKAQKHKRKSSEFKL